MKKKTSSKSPPSSERDAMRLEYDFSGGIRGKHHKSRLNGYTIKIHNKDRTTLVQQVRREGGITLEPDVQRYFPNSRAVNRALRTLIALFPPERKSASLKPRSIQSGRKATKL